MFAIWPPSTIRRTQVATVQMRKLVNESPVPGLSRKTAIQQKFEPQGNLRRFRHWLLFDRKFQMLPSGGPLDGSCPLRTVAPLGDSHAISLRVFDSQRQLSADLAAAHLERVFNRNRQGTCIR